MDWSTKQTRILTANGLAISRYHTPERGYPVIESDLPHHHLQGGSVACHETFLGWRRRRPRPRRYGDDVPPPSIITGAWSRTLFRGFYPEGNEDEFTTDADETVHNLQTPSLFVDLRIPLTRPRFGNRRSIEELSDDELRLYARQHVFAGYTLLTEEEEKSKLSIIGGGGGADREGRRGKVATRHHCVDWNFVGWNPRTIPNRWYVEVVDDVPRVNGEGSSSISVPVVQKWNEWAYATDDLGHHYYLEKWERMDGDEGGRGRVLALKRRPPPSGGAASGDDDREGVLVVVGDHFSYVRGRSPSLINSLDLSDYRSSTNSLVDLVDEAVARGDRSTAEAFLSVEACHGRIDGHDCDGDGSVESDRCPRGRWIIDSAIPPWREGSCLLGDGEDDSDDGIRVEGRSVHEVHVTWDGTPWDVFECSGIGSVGELRELFGIKAEGSEETGGDGRTDLNGSGSGGLSKL